MLTYGFLTLFLASIFQGTFGLGMKEHKPFSWSSFWLVFTIVGVIIIPNVWTYIEVPNYWRYIMQADVRTIFISIGCGFIWGIASLLFSKAIEMNGMSLTYGINMGVSSALGAILPLIIFGGGEKGSLAVVLVGSAIMAIGVAIVTKAGILRDGKSSSVLGIIVAVLAGLCSSALNIGFSYANEISGSAISDGVSSVSAGLISWVVVLIGGAIPNLFQALLVLIRKKEYKDFIRKDAALGYLKAVVTAILWFSALGIYAKAAFMLGSLGTVIGWIIFNAIALVVSNIIGLSTGEWKGHKRPRMVFLIGNIILIVSLFVVGMA